MIDTKLQEPLVSVVILTYNRRACLERCLTHVARQSYSNLEIIVVDNASEDGTAGMVTTLFPSVKLLRHSRNLYFTGGFNSGLRAISGEFVLLLADDVLLESDYLSKLLPTITNNPKIGLLTGVLHHEDTGEVFFDGGMIRFTMERLHLITDPQRPQSGLLDGTQRTVEYVLPILTLARRTVLESVGLFDDHFKFCWEDIDMCLKLRLNGYQLVVDSTAAGYHIRPASRADREKNETQFHIQKNPFLLYFGYAPLGTLVAFLAYRSAWLVKQLVLAQLGLSKPINGVTIRANTWWLGHIPLLIQKRISVTRSRVADVTISL